MGAMILATISAMLLTGCMLSPGRFTSEMILKRDGTFSFTYNGEIQLITMSWLAQLEADSIESAADEAIACFDDTSFEERECTEEERAAQKKEFSEAASRAKQEQQKQADEVRKMFGGIDITDPAAAQELARRLERQAGWNKVTPKENGLFEVEYAISGRLNYDFLFPTVEQFPVMNYFVIAGRRDDGTVRIDAPAFNRDSLQLKQMAALAGTGVGGTDRYVKGIPGVDGTFTIITDGKILANNTDAGPADSPDGQKLSWKINSMTDASPTALIDLKQ